MQPPILPSLNKVFNSVTDDFKMLFRRLSPVATELLLFFDLVLVFPLTREAPVVKAVGRNIIRVTNQERRTIR